MAFEEYRQLDAIGLAGLVRRKEISAAELLDAAIEQVETFDPQINAIVQNLEDEAREQIKNGLDDGPFSGVPFLLKDNGIDLTGTINRNGSRFHSDLPATRNSALTERYLGAGLVIFGKTNTPEFAISGSTESKALGQCHNPWDLARGTGGSSGGSAAAVAAAYAPMAHASDGGGSIRNPSSGCGVFGLKPSRGRVVCGPNVYESVGGMAVHHAITRSVRDSAALLDATSVARTGTGSSDRVREPAFLEAINKPPRPLRIAFHLEAHRHTAVHPECQRAVLLAAGLCSDNGHIVEEAGPKINGDEGLEINSLIWKVSAVQSVAETSRLLDREPNSGELEWITQLLAEEGALVSALEYANAINAMHKIGQEVRSFFDSYDVVLSPVVSQPPWLLDVYENSYVDSQSYFETVASYSPFCWPYNMSGQPAMSVPLYWTENNLPVGVQFAGRFGEEATLLQLARQLEAAAPWFDRLPPVFSVPASGDAGSCGMPSERVDREIH